MKIEYGVKRTWPDGYTEYESMMDYESAVYRVKFYHDEMKEFDSSVIVREVGDWEDVKNEET